jgi:uncharacterized protein
LQVDDIRHAPCSRITRVATEQHDFNDRIVEETGHRPWPMPDRPWIMTQTWHDLLFAHWPITPDELAPKIPREFPLDLFDGNAWLGVVPFRMTNVSPRGVPSLPWISAFPELNVRTYVTLDGKPGVYFFSLDAGNSLAAYAARALLNLPYFPATMSVESDGTVIDYDSNRSGDRSARLVASYRPTGARFEAQPGTLEYFLTERYCLYHLNRGGEPYRLEIHHPPWPLQPAEARIAINTMATAAGIALPAVEPLLHFAKRQDMVGWAPHGIEEK